MLAFSTLLATFVLGGSSPAQGAASQEDAKRTLPDYYPHVAADIDRLLPKEIRKAELDMTRRKATCTLCEQEIARESRLLKADATSEQSFEQAQERLAVVQA